MARLNFDIVKLTLTKLLEIDNFQYVNDINFFLTYSIGTKEFDYVSEFCQSNIHNSNMITILACTYLIKNNKEDFVIELLNKAINMNNSNAMCILAGLYEIGTGVKLDSDKAIELYEKAIELKNSEAMRLLANLYTHDKRGSYEKAFELYSEAINLGNVGAMYSLAVLYEVKYGRNCDKAVDLYDKSYELGFVNAMLDRADEFREPIEKNIEKNILKSIETYSKVMVMYPFISEIRKYIVHIVKENPEIIFEKINKIDKLESENNDLKTYITHLETLPLGKEYQNALNDFNNLNEN